MKCADCGTEDPEDFCGPEDHPGRCCDCFDLGFGMPLEKLNKERAAKGKPPLKSKAGTP